MDRTGILPAVKYAKQAVRIRKVMKLFIAIKAIANNLYTHYNVSLERSKNMLIIVIYKK